MIKIRMNTKDFLRLGVTLGEATQRATDFVANFILGGGDKSRLQAEVSAIVANPSAYVTDVVPEFAADLTALGLHRQGAPLPLLLTPIGKAVLLVKADHLSGGDDGRFLGYTQPHLWPAACATPRGRV
jgi:hypothetical protein